MKLFYMPRIIAENRRNSGSAEVYALLEYVYSLLYCQKLPEIEKTSNGKPFFPRKPEVHFSISHCATHVLCAVSDAPVGVDIESPRPVSPRAVGYFCAPDELRHFQPLELWVLKESFVKLCGGVLTDVKKYRFSRGDNGIIASDPSVSAKLFHAENCLIAVCTTGKLPQTAERVDIKIVSRALPGYL